jgi:tRNA threonylcarbamoyladenosine biosynthesis protein TsaB
MYVAIDTSTETASVALVRDNEALAEFTWHCGRNHSVELLPRLLHLLDQAKLSLESVDGIIVARGPGGYNGLRVGVSAAKGLAFSLGVPIVGLSTLEAEAYQHAEIGLPVCPIFNAGREEIATAIYQKEQDKWRRMVAEHITTLEELCSQTTARTVFCGDYIPVIAKQLRKKLKQKAVMLSPAAGLRRAGFLAELGLRRLKAGDYDNLATLQPIYLRRPSITRPKHR